MFKNKRKKVKYKYQSTVPYGLHDQRVNKMESKKKKLTLTFEEGYIELKEPYKQVKGDIIINEIEEDFCFVYLLGSGMTSKGDFTGCKMVLKDFIAKYDHYSFEICDDLYGYNQVMYSGYLYLEENESLVEMMVSIYHFGDIIFQTEAE